VAVEQWSARCAREIRLHKLTQFLFFEQWQRVHDACRARSIQIMGDLPIFVAHDSADVWARPELFRLDADGRPTVLTGVPPDYFSATGQLWGNPHYRWDVLAGGSNGFAFCWRSSIVSASIISGDSRRRGKCRLARPRPYEANG
jgi:4-alpha-glucanotransferase